MMDCQGQLNVSHLVGSAVDVTHYTTTLHHPLQGYGGTIAPGTASMPSTATITLGYSVSHPAHCGAAPPYTVALTPQVATHPHIQYYYEATEPVPPHLQVRYNTSTTLGLQPATPPPPPALPPPPQPRNKPDEPNLGHQSQGNNVRRKNTPRTEGTSAKVSRKCCRNRGEAYISASGKLVPAKKYVELDCQCRNECLAKLGTLADREAVFTHFWNIGDFRKQNAHLAQSVVMVPSGGGGSGGGGGGDKRRGRVEPSLDEKHLRTVRRIYYVKLQEDQTRVRVCKTQFLRLHGVSNGRLDRVLQALHCQQPHALQDRRGQHAPSNKTSQEDMELVTQHIINLQEGEMESCGEALSQEATQKMSVKKMHELYQQWCEGLGKMPVSLWVYRQVKLRLIPHQGDERLKTRRISNSLNATNEDVTIECQGVEEAVLGPADTTTTITDIDKHSIHSIATTTPSKPATTTATIRTTNSTTTSESTTTTTTTKTTTIATSTTTSPAITTVNSTTTTTNTTTTITTATAQDSLQQRKKRRKQRQEDWKISTMNRKQRKTSRNRGEAYITSTGKLRGMKIYRDEPCECRHKCIPTLGTPETRQRVFDNFWGLGNFTRQNAYIARMVTLAPLVHRRSSAALSRTYSRVYSIQLQEGSDMVRVCKLAFLRLHGVSNGRVHRVLQAVACQSPFALKDRRGRHSPINKTQEEDVTYAFNHMCTFHLEDPAQPDRNCSPPHLNVGKMYRLYRDQCSLDNRKPVGSFVYRKILKERMNLAASSPGNSLTQPHSDIKRKMSRS